MKPGIYDAQITAAGLIADKNNEPQPFMKFKTSEGEITWFGNLKNAQAQEISVKAAIAAGFHGNDWDQFAEGLIYFNEVKFTITVVEEEYQGKKRTRVKWVNAKNDMKAMSAVEVKSKVSSAGLFAQKKKEVGVKTSGSEDLSF